MNLLKRRRNKQKKDKPALIGFGTLSVEELEMVLQAIDRVNLSGNRNQARKAVSTLDSAYNKLQAELSRNIYSLQGLEALMLPELGLVCQRLMVESY